MSLPTVAVIATGGTIAGMSSSAVAASYTAGVIPASELVAGIPALGELAALRIEQPFNVDSKDMSPTHWLVLTRRVKAAVDEAGVDGVVVTHGTDTLEESAYFLDLALGTDKPVILTGAMRPATALSSDGPRNLYDAVAVAASPASRGRGVMVAVAGEIFAARGVRKVHTHQLAAFGAAGAAVGQTAPLRFFHAPTPRPRAVLDAAAVDALPPVDIIEVPAGATPTLLDAAIHAGARGIVLVLPGNGSLPHTWLETVRRATGAGIPIVRASRVPAGGVSKRDEDLACGTLPAGELPPSQARIAVMVALACGDRALLATLLAS